MQNVTQKCVNYNLCPVPLLFLTHLLGDGAVPVLVHGLEQLLQGSLLPHELLEGQLAVEVPVHLLEELLHLGPATQEND